MLYKYRFLIYAFLILIFAFCFGLLYVSLSSKDDPINYNTKTKELNGIFSVYDDKVYALVPSNGYYEVKDADPTTFRIFPDNFADAHIGLDDHHVYAGNIIMEGLKPDQLKGLGNNYYTDGERTYYCARNSENNESLGAIGFVVQLVGQSMGLTDKPQNYWYPFIELPKGKTYESKPGFALAVNNGQAFYKGIELPQANPKNIRKLQIRYWDGDLRESTVYMTDGKKVYFENQILPLPYNPSLYEVGIEGDVPSRSAYLINPENGMVYVDGRSFDTSKAPYRLMSDHFEHANQVLFSSRDGIYFYNTESEKIERAGESPFTNNEFKEIAPDIFSSGDKVYYLSASEHWGRKTGLRGRTTNLWELKNVSVSGLKKISLQDARYGNVWQAGNRFFYFDELGSSQFMSSAVYEIHDTASTKLLVNSNNLNSDDIRDLVDAKKITPASSELILKATTSYKNDWWQSYWLIFGVAGLAYLISFLFRNVKVHPFLIKDGYLIFNNLSFKKYKITDIDKVVFRSMKTSHKTGGSSGKMQVLLKNGKTSWNVTFSTKMTLTSESEAEIISYIKELQEILEKEGINSEFLS